MFNLKKEEKYTYLMCINQSAFQKLKPIFSPYFFFLFIFRFSFQNLSESKGVFLLILSPSTFITTLKREAGGVLKKKRERNKKSPRGSRSGTCPGLSPARWPAAGCSAARSQRLSPCKFWGTWRPRRWWTSGWSPPTWNPAWQRTRGWQGPGRRLWAPSRCRSCWVAWRWWAACCPAPSWGESRGCTWVGDALRLRRDAGALTTKRPRRPPRLPPCTCTDTGTDHQKVTWRCPATERGTRQIRPE